VIIRAVIGGVKEGDASKTSKLAQNATISEH